MPPGLTLPNSTSATALPASTPGNQASRMAGEEAATFVSVSGRPLNSTTTNGLPVALIASMSCCCLPGRPMSLREAASPLWPRLSPSASTTWSAELGRGDGGGEAASEPHSSAGVLSGGSLSRIVQPWAKVVFGSCALMPASTDTASASLPCPHHGPSMSCWSSPSGPITATDLAGSSGSVALSFLSSTMDLPAAARVQALVGNPRQRRGCRAPGPARPRPLPP